MQSKGPNELGVVLLGPWGWGVSLQHSGFVTKLKCSSEVCEPEAVLNLRLKLIFALLICTASATVPITILFLYASMVHTQTVIY